jgi:hypothetical protein
MIVILDFDGTVVSHEFPLIGNDIGAVPVLKTLINNGHKLVLFTMRCNNYLEEAVQWFRVNDIPLYGIQTNPTQSKWTSSPKAHGQLIIDDIAAGCPLKYDSKISEQPFVDWDKMKQILINTGWIN